MEKLLEPVADVDEFVRSVTTPIRRRAVSGFMLGFFGRIDHIPTDVVGTFLASAFETPPRRTDDPMVVSVMVFLDEATEAMRHEERRCSALDARLQKIGFAIGPFVRALPIAMVAWSAQEIGPVSALVAGTAMLVFDLVLSSISVASLTHLRSDLLQSLKRIRLPWG